MCAPAAHTGVMPASFLVVPQWQGSISSRAMRLVDGAEAIRGDLPASATVEVEVAVGAGEALDTGVLRYSSLIRTRERTRAALGSTRDLPIIIGGDCGVSLAGIEHALATTGGDLAVLWFDAHVALNTAATSPSGAFSGMVLRTLLGEGAEGLVPDAGAVLRPGQLVLAASRDIDPEEARYLEEHALSAIPTEELATPDALLAALRATGATRVYAHIDLDALDPAEIAGLGNPIPFGLTVATLTELITAVRAEFTLAGASIAGFSPVSPLDAEDDLPSILRIIGALSR